MALSDLDAAQIIKAIYNPESETLSISNQSGISPAAHDEINLTYVSGGPADGEIETVVYKNGGSTVSTLTLSYDGSGNLSSVVRS